LSARQANAVEFRHLCKSFGETLVVRDVSLAIREGEFFSLLGPSGCGKTTLLRLLAGFESPTSGEILLAGSGVQDVPARKRDLNIVFQHYALFPHLSVARNVAFGLEMQKVAGDEIQRRVAEALALVRLQGLGARMPRELSGGQQQRVALARALITRPAVLLLDEPLGALDLKLRREMQSELKALQRSLDTTFVYVTHDQEEALAMSDRVGVMQDGQLLQVGAPHEIYDRPVNRFVAAFIGESNFLAAEVTGYDDRDLIVRSAGESLRVRGERIAIGRRVTLALRPERLRIMPAGGNAAVNLLDGRLRECVYLGTGWRCEIELVDGSVMRASLPPQDSGVLSVGSRVMLTFAPPDVAILESDS
jgi:spermidine/putrescine transport system ATP-binding protein